MRTGQEEMTCVIVGIEAGGTSFKTAICIDKRSATTAADDDDSAVTYGKQDIIHTEVFDTTEPQETLTKVTQWIKEICQKNNYAIQHVGIACFGPVDLDVSSETYGFITSTPKIKWQFTNILGFVEKSFPDLRQDQFSFDTDVNAPANSELRHYNASQGNKLSSIAYITVGTGIGVGLVINGRTVHGLIHPEGGHLYGPLHERDLDMKFQGTCPFHGSCIEGMASAGAIAARKGIKNAEIKNIPDEDEVWDVVAHYLAHLCISICLLTSVERIVISGGVLKRLCLYPKIQTKFKQLLNGYMKHPLLAEDPSEYITGSEFGDSAGIIGALCLQPQ